MIFFKQNVPGKSQKVPKNTLFFWKNCLKYRKVSKRRDFIVSVLLSEHAKSSSVLALELMTRGVNCKWGTELMANLGEL